MTTPIDTTRRNFLKLAGAGTAISLACVNHGAFGQEGEETEARPGAVGRERPLKLAMASYTFRKFTLEEALEMTGRVGLKAICLKSFHLPLTATADEIAKAAAKVKDAGILLYGGGVITMKNDEQVDQAFQYAKAAGMSKIIGAPSPEMLPRINDKVQQYDIQVCIHNHGPGDKYFPTPIVAYKQIKNLDKRIGLCHDIGHTVRYGEDAIAATEQCADRMYDIHIKDVTEAAKTGHGTECGRGIIDLPAVLRALVKIEYSGFVSFEYEQNADDPLPGLAESVGYVRGILDAF